MAESGLTVPGEEPECLYNLAKGQVHRSDRANCPAFDHELGAVYCTGARLQDKRLGTKTAASRFGGRI